MPCACRGYPNLQDEMCEQMARPLTVAGAFDVSAELDRDENPRSYRLTK
jgi:hypothetical protein